MTALSEKDRAVEALSLLTLIQQAIRATDHHAVEDVTHLLDGMVIAAREKSA